VLVAPGRLGLDMDHPELPQGAERLGLLRLEDDEPDFLHLYDHDSFPATPAPVAATATTFRLAIFPRTTWAVCWSPR